jgi:hypothetical protein
MKQLEQLKLLFDYTKFHIGLYTALATIVAALVASKESLFQFDSRLMGAAIGFICIAGLAGGVIASSIPHYQRYDRFWDDRIGPMRWKALKAEYWTYIEHTAFWSAVICAALSIVAKRMGWLA